jgi:hypothetical protein
MGKLGKISVIKKDHNGSSIQTMQDGLSQKGMTRIPGTGVFKYPYKELDGKYRTGLDPDAAYIRRIQDPLERKLEIERVTKLKKDLQEALGDVDLGPRSKFWNYSLASSTNDENHIKPYKLMDGDNLFDLSVPMQAITFAWLRVHPTIASNYQAYENGEFPAETQFYVADDDLESQIIFKKKQSINKAIAKFDNLSIQKKKKVARLLGLPVTDDTKDEVVYNMVDNVLKEVSFKAGKFKGLSTIEVFERYADMKDDLLHVRDLVKQAISFSVYRSRPNGKIYKGEYEVAKDEDDLVTYLMNEDNQDELLTLEAELKTKKIAAL